MKDANLQNNIIGEEGLSPFDAEASPRRPRAYTADADRVVAEMAQRVCLRTR